MKLAFKVHTYLVERENDLALFSCFGSHVYIKSPLVTENFEKVCERLMSPQTFEAILEELSQVNEAELSSFIDLLGKNHLLLKYQDSTAEDLKLIRNSYLSNFYESPSLVQAALKKIGETEIHILDLCGLGEPMISKITLAGFKKLHLYSQSQLSDFQIRQSLDHSLFLVLGSWQKARAIEKLNHLFYRSQTPWLLVLIDNLGGQIGPYFSGKDSPCFSCLEKRKASFLEAGTGYNLLTKTFFEDRPNQFDNPTFPLIAESLTSLAATEVYKLVSGLPSPRIRHGAILLDAINIKTKFNELFPVAFCEVCSGFEEYPLGSTRSKRLE